MDENLFLRNELQRERELRIKSETELEAKKLEVFRLHESLRVHSSFDGGLPFSRGTEIFRRIYQVYTDAIFIIDHGQHVLLSCNNKAVEMFGVDDHYHMVMEFEKMVFHFPGRSNQKNILSEVYKANLYYEGESEFKNFHGKIFTTHIVLTPFEIEENKYFLVQLSDITEKRKTEKNLQKSQKRYRDLINYSQALICTHDLEGNIINLNHAALDAIKISEEQAHGLNIVQLLPNQYKAEFINYLERVHENTSDKGIMVLMNREGKKRFLMYQNYMVENETEPPYVVGFAQDISERVIMERKLKKAIALAEASVSARKIFLATMSHEMRTPLNGILGMAGLLSKTLLDSRQSGYLNIIKISADNLLMIINDILDIAKIESGKMELEEITFDVAETVKNCVRSLIYKAEEKGLTIYTHLLEGDVNVVRGDPFRFNQILLNLLNNSLKFTKEGYVEISCKKIRETPAGAEFEFCVKDTGIGIAEDKLQRIFDGFTQADPEITRKFGGTGLGLNICKNLLSMMGGTIQVESVPNQGSTFIFNVPFKKGIREDVKVTDPVVVNFSSLGPLKVLLVEDNEVNQFLAQSILEEWGFHVIPAMNGIQALQQMTIEDFDLVLMDIHMPEMDGLEATRRIRKMEDHKKSSVTIIAITADALKGDEVKYFSAGMNDYLTKPFSEEALFHKISGHLSEKSVADDYKNFTGRKSFMEERKTPLYDLSQIETAAHGNPQVVQKLIAIFLSSSPSILKEMEQSLEQKNIEQVRKLAHKLKTSIDTLQIDTLKKEIREIEHFTSAEMQEERLTELFIFLQLQMEKVMTQLKNKMRKLQQEEL